ncbi:MAG: hypothetical protein HY795_06250 [Desulfovibrio sp.]|nr:hypothetical protein [Desulfovibrio sp.]MBI4961300.1 hypothetical protein [Desulfovibrio sp.]
MVGYYVMLVKVYLTRVSNKKTQTAYEVCTFIIILLVITIIIDLNTPFVGLINVDTAPFTWAYERAVYITGLTPH